MTWCLYTPSQSDIVSLYSVTEAHSVFILRHRVTPCLYTPTQSDIVFVYSVTPCPCCLYTPSQSDKVVLILHHIMTVLSSGADLDRVDWFWPFSNRSDNRVSDIKKTVFFSFVTLSALDKQNDRVPKRK